MVHAVGPVIDVVRRHYGVDHLHEPGRSLDFSSDSSFSHSCVRRNFVVINDFFYSSRLRRQLHPGFYSVDVKVCVRKLPPFPLARDTARARECGAI